ncbi:protein YLS7 [Olea europaea var. sylvestris]|uniref:protein YLS7 n=1 Tax=Olea europaea var. sylvestris TaxID=158386 RepID=UPI000C1D2066|nr:protein YLS7 [Olea europaea var. sylvestris]
MASVSVKEQLRTAYPKTLTSIVASVGGLALFLILASTILVSQPIGSTVRGYFYGVDRSRKIDSLLTLKEQFSSVSTLNESVSGFNSQYDGGGSIRVGGADGQDTPVDKKQNPDSQDKSELSGSRQKESKNLKDESLHSNIKQQETGNKTSALPKVTEHDENAPSNNTREELKDAVISPTATNRNQSDVVDSGCDLYHGKWIYESTGPLYTNNSCPIITQMQNCQGNGRPDKDYENWRWKPSQCDLPRFEAKKFLELMRGKTLAFIGDSVARNQMEALLCILWQVEVPKNRGNKRMQRYYFRSTSTMIVRIWSSWLIHQTSEPFDFAPAGVVKLHLDAPDEVFMQYIMDFDVIVLSSGHWFAKQSVYILNNEIVGGQLWWPDKSRKKKIDNIEAFGISIETIVTALVTHRNYTGLTIVRSFSPDHYEGGAWNTGGSCTGKVRPALDSELVENGFTNIMHEKQVTGFNRAMKKKTNKSKMKLMDITEAFSHRHDGHPGPYRSPDPNKITKRGPDGRPPPQDCLHWCMPGPVDTWNELVLEVVRREFEDRQNIAS